MDRAKILSLAAKEFAHEHKDILIIMADPKTDTIFAGYNDSFTLGKIKQNLGGEPVVKSVLLYSKFNKSLTKYQTFKMKADVFIMNLAEILWLPVTKVPEFFKFIHDALFYLPKGKDYKLPTEDEIKQLPPGEERVTLEEALHNLHNKK